MTVIPDHLQESYPLKVAVLVSGSGSNLQVLIDAMNTGELPIEIVGVISNVKDAYAVTRANEAGIQTTVLSHIPAGAENAGKRMGIKTFERYAATTLEKWQPDLIVLAGFMRVLSEQFITAAPAPMINLHPSLLPQYKGLNTHARAIQAGERLHGCSVHVVTPELDAGQVLTQGVLQIDASDSPEHLQKRVQRLEHQLLPWTLLLIAQGIIPSGLLKQATSVDKASTPTAATGHLPALPLRLWLADS